MNTQPTTLTPRTIGETENALRATLRRALEGTGLGYHDWVALKLISETQPPINEPAATAEIVDGLKINETSATKVINHLRERQLLTDSEEQLTPTARGATLFKELNTRISTNSQQIWDGISQQDLATAHRVLTTLRNRANRILGN